MSPIIIRKRTINKEDLHTIQAVVSKHCNRGRTHISKVLCRKWNWVQPNGHLKDMACREVLLTLERKGLLKLPPRKNGIRTNKRKSIEKPVIDESPLSGEINQHHSVVIKMVRWTSYELLWNSLVHHYHYQSYSSIVGQNLKYMAFIDDRPVACLGWGSAAWAVKSRDSFIDWNKPTKKNNLHLIVNNTRFLILPWISVKCLASKILALNAKRIVDDWITIYNHPLYLLETFVEKDRFAGTCYKAANWICVGQTKGTAKKGHDHMFHGSIKDVYLYALGKDFRKKLND